jgi:hypothetical protein
MIHRCFINHITKLEDAHGKHILNHDEISSELVNYYKNILSETDIDKTLTINHITQHIPALITPEQNQALMRPISKEEVDHEIKEMPLGKVLWT